MEKETRHEAPSEGARLAKGVTEGIIKAIKQFKIYPPNNPIYINASGTVYEKLRSFFNYEETLSLHISQYKLFYNDEVIYHNPEKDDNLALFLFKDGLREITFSSSIPQNEVDDFLRILTIDFEKEAPDDDIVTILWQKDFEHIRYVADDVLLSDEEMSDEKRAYEKIEENPYNDDSIQKAYKESLDTEPLEKFTPSPVTSEDLQNISEGIKSQQESKVEKLTAILFELLYLTKESATFRNVTLHLRAQLEYCLKKGDFRNASNLLNRIRQDIKDGAFGESEIKNLNSVYSSINSSSFIKIIGDILDSSTIIEEAEYLDYVRHLGKNSIRAFVQLLGEVDSLKGRHLVSESLSTIGHLDIKTLATGLQDSRWNVVRDTIFILGRIDTPETFEHLKDILSHTNEKIRREAVRTIGNIKNPDTYLYLSKALNDGDQAVRINAVRALVNIRTAQVKKILLSALSSKSFASKTFNEKKEFYGAIALWQDNDIRNFLTSILKTRKIWRRKMYDETKACAAHALGILRDKEAIPLLEKTSKAKNRILRESSLAAINKINT